jgi:acetyl-CoA C-acetyltransferase
MELKDIVIISACRTAMGKFGGTLKNIPSWDLGAVAVREALRRANFQGNQVDDVILGPCKECCSERWRFILSPGYYA